MCGITAYIGNKTFDPKEIELLFLHNEKRGEDGCGYYNHHLNEYIVDNITKYAQKASTSALKEKMVPSNMFIGHTRKSSFYGTKTYLDSHPFFYEGIYKDIIGVHNGTLQNENLLAEKYGIDDSNLIDSQILYKILSETEGYDVLSDLEGKASLVFTLNDSNLYCFRKNEDRPLFYMRREDELFISSSSESLNIIGKGELKINEFKSEYLYQIDMSSHIVKTTPIKDNANKPKVVTQPAIVHDYRGSSYNRGQTKRAYDYDQWFYDDHLDDHGYYGRSAGYLPFGNTSDKNNSSENDYTDVTSSFSMTSKDSLGNKTKVADVRVMNDLYVECDVFQVGSNSNLREIIYEDDYYCNSRKMWVKVLVYNDGSFKEERSNIEPAQEESNDQNETNEDEIEESIVEAVTLTEQVYDNMRELRRMDASVDDAIVKDMEDLYNVILSVMNLSATKQ